MPFKAPPENPRECVGYWPWYTHDLVYTTAALDFLAYWIWAQRDRKRNHEEKVARNPHYRSSREIISAEAILFVEARLKVIQRARTLRIHTSRAQLEIEFKGGRRGDRGENPNAERVRYWREETMLAAIGQNVGKFVTQRNLLPIGPSAKYRNGRSLTRPQREQVLGFPIVFPRTFDYLRQLTGHHIHGGRNIYPNEVDGIQEAMNYLLLDMKQKAEEEDYVDRLVVDEGDAEEGMDLEGPTVPPTEEVLEQAPAQDQATPSTSGFAPAQPEEPQGSTRLSPPDRASQPLVSPVAEPVIPTVTLPDSKRVPPFAPQVVDPTIEADPTVTPMESQESVAPSLAGAAGADPTPSPSTSTVSEPGCLLDEQELMSLPHGDRLVYDALLQSGNIGLAVDFVKRNVRGHQSEIGSRNATGNVAKAVEGNWSPG